MAELSNHIVPVALFLLRLLSHRVNRTVFLSISGLVDRFMVALGAPAIFRATRNVWQLAQQRDYSHQAKKTRRKRATDFSFFFGGVHLQRGCYVKRP